MQYPGSQDVAIAWLGTLGLTIDGIGSDLPGDPTTWATHGFIQVPMVTGGSPQVHVPMREPMVQVDAWTNRPGGELPPWKLADHNANTIVAAMHRQDRPVEIDLGGDYFPVRLHSIWALSEPRRILGDPSRYGRTTLDAAMRWVVLDG